MFKSEIKDILSKPAWQLFIVITVFYAIGLFLFSHFVWSTDFYELNHARKTNFETQIDMYRRIDMVKYIFSPVYILSLSYVILWLIKIGLLSANVEFENKLLLKIIITGLFILSLPLWIKAVWFVLLKGSYSYDEVRYFYPFSILYFFDPGELNMKVVKALGRINLYHLAFMVFVAWAIKIYSSLSFTRLFIIVLYTYGLAFILLQLFIILIFI